MAIIEVDQPMIPSHPTISLPEVRRLEAVSFRSWPSASTRFDGTWAIRLTAGHPAKRLNSVNPLDPADHSNLDERISRAAHTFDGFGRPLIFRQSPLAPQELENRLDARGWLRFDETIVMLRDLDESIPQRDLTSAPVGDVGRWLDQCVLMDAFPVDVKPGLSELIDRVHGEVALFLGDVHEGEAHCAAMIVRFGELAGLFEVVTHPRHRRKGLGKRLVLNALAWAKAKGSKRAWLQVVADNAGAVKLYEETGFQEAYRYAYRKAPEGYHG